MASPILWVILVVTCALLLPGTGNSQDTGSFERTAPPTSSDWPQVVLLESKGTTGPDKGAAGTGMPVPDPRQLNYNAIHYTLNLQVDPSWGWIAGKVSTIVQVLAEPMNEFVLDLRSGMTCAVASINHPYVENLMFRQENDRLIIELPTPIMPGGIARIEVQYWGQPQPEGLFGYQVGQNEAGRSIIATVSEPWSARSWWPCKDDPGDKASVTMNIDAPAGMTAVSNGVFVGMNRQTWTWSETLPISTYLVSLSVAEYVEIHDQYDGPAGPINLRHYVFAEDEAAAREDLSILPEMLDFCGELFGPYPFAGQPFGIAECAWDQAMEHPTAVTYGDVLITGTHQFDTVLVHELSHMWFGDLISPVDWTHIWLNEGFATYVEALWAEHVYGPSGLRNFMVSHDWGHGYGEDSLIRDPDNGYPPYYFRTIAYHKGAWVLHMLRRWLGDDVFFDAVSQYLNNPQLRFNTAESVDFQQACEAASGQDLAWFFDQWLYRTTYPVLRLDWQNNWQEGANEIRIRLRQEQDPEPDGSRPAYQFPVDLRMVGAGLDTTITVMSHRLDQEYVIPLGATITKVYVDSDRWLLHDMVDDATNKSRNVAQAQVSLMPAYPNPFNPRTLFRWESVTATDDLVEVFDLQGRRILSEDLGRQPAGVREYLWQGIDDSGRQYPSGTYLYRITCQGRTEAGVFSRQMNGKVTLAR